MSWPVAESVTTSAPSSVSSNQAVSPATLKVEGPRVKLSAPLAVGVILPV